MESWRSLGSAGVICLISIIGIPGCASEPVEPAAPVQKVEAPGKTAEALLEDARVWREGGGDLDHAIELYTRAIEKDPNHVRAHGRRAEAWREKGEVDRAIDDYNRAVKLDPTWHDVFKARAIVWEKKGDMEKALKDYSWYIKRRPEDADARYKRARLYQYLGLMIEARLDYDRVLELDPEHTWAYAYRGVIRGDHQQDRRGAIADYTEAIRREPGNAVLLMQRGASYFLVREWKNARADFRKSFEIDAAAWEPAWYMSWVARCRLGEEDAAAKEAGEYLDRREAGTTDWYGKIFAFQANRMSEEDLLAAAVNEDEAIQNERMCEAHYYAGVKRLLEDDIPAARKHFEACVATGLETSAESISARSELRAMEQAE